jgi:CRISPR/Cas system-associated exonuclease Cas4 (RecB family)
MKDQYTKGYAKRVEMTRKQFEKGYITYQEMKERMRFEIAMWEKKQEPKE